jgi:hypothetical protein
LFWFWGVGLGVVLGCFWLGYWVTGFMWNWGDWGMGFSFLFSFSLLSSFPLFLSLSSFPFFLFLASVFLVFDFFFGCLFLALVVVNFSGLRGGLDLSGY